MIETVYLVGQISPKYEITYRWRKKVVDYFANSPYGNFRFINPCSNNFNKSTLQKKEYAVQRKSRTWGIDLLVPKDRSYVDRSTIGLVNMNWYDKDKPLLGSFFELAWYRDCPEKAVIAFAEDKDSYICQHPFVQKAVDVWCDDEHEAIELLETYFVDVESM